MVYRFAEDGSGEVVAETCKPGIGSFKGLHYPASDIPVQARELYKRNLLRVIADVDAVPVAIEPAHDEKGQLLDLSYSILRSVSPIHIEYLKNMGVRASMSISILVDGELWGLFACHHYSAKSPTFEIRSVCELFSQMYSLRLESCERKEVMDYERRARDITLTRCSYRRIRSAGSPFPERPLDLTPARKSTLKVTPTITAIFEAT